jgi:Uma2 family endonuclease
MFMFQSAAREVTFDEFLDWYPDGYGRYELYDGAIVEMHQQEPMNK